MRTRTIALTAAACSTITVASFTPGRFVDASVQMGCWSAMLTASGVVMAIAGVWAGMVFAAPFRALLERRREGIDPVQLTMAEHLQRVIFLSAVVLALSLAAHPTIAVLRSIHLPAEVASVLRGAGFATLTAAVLTQIVALLMVLGLGEDVRRRPHEPTAEDQRLRVAAAMSARRGSLGPEDGNPTSRRASIESAAARPLPRKSVEIVGSP